MNARQFALALASTILMGAGPQPPSSAPILSNAAQPDAAPSIGSSHKLESTYFRDRHADGRALTANGYTSVVTFKNVTCANTKGCNIGFDGMVQVLCENKDTNGNAYEVAFHLVSEVNGVYGSVAPLQEDTWVWGQGKNAQYIAIGEPFYYQNYQGVANGTTNSGALQVELVQKGATTDIPDCILGDWTVSIPFYSP